MKILNMKAKAKKKFRVTTDSAYKLPVFDNVLDRDFIPNPNEEAGIKILSDPAAQART